MYRYRTRRVSSFTCGRFLCNADQQEIFYFKMSYVQDSSNNRETREPLNLMDSPLPTDVGLRSRDERAGKTLSKPSSAITANLMILAVACSLSFFTYGYQIVVMNGPGVIVEAWINESYVRRGYETDAASENNSITPRLPGLAASKILLLYGLATGALSGGGIIGAMFAGTVADRIGRRGGHLIGATAGFAAAGLTGLSVYIFSPELLIVGRALFGISAGAATALAPMYLIESTPPSVRGTVSTFNQIGCVAGLFLCQILCLSQFLGTEQRWALLFFLAGIAPALQIVLTLLSPESPRYLYITKSRTLAAVHALKRLRPANTNLDDELADYEAEAYANRQTPRMTLGQLLAKRQYSQPLMIAVMVQLSMCWCGVQGIHGYSSILLQRAGLSPAAASYTNLSIGVISIVTAITLTLLIDRIGRRVLHLGGLTGMIVCGLLIVLFSALPTWSSGAASSIKIFSIANIVCVLLYHASYSLGPASIPWTFMSELFDQKARGAAISVGSFISWSSSTIIFIFFPSLERVLGFYVFLPFVALLIVFVTWLWKYMPETKGKSLKEIGDILERR